MMKAFDTLFNETGIDATSYPHNVSRLDLKNDEVFQAKLAEWTERLAPYNTEAVWLKERQVMQLR